MLTGLRAADGPRIQALCGQDRRLLLRIGSLLQERLAVSELVLEEAAQNESLRRVLMDRQLSRIGDIEALRSLCAGHDCMDQDLTLIAGTDENNDDRRWRVMAYEDEVDNLLTPAAPAPPSGVAALLPNLDASIRAPVEGLIAATADDQRAAALEQLRYAAPSLSVLTELMPMVLADGAEVVRERAIAVLVQAGARPVVIDLIRALHSGDERAITRLGDHLHGLDEAQFDLVIGALLAVIARNQVGPALIDLTTHLAPRLIAHRGLRRLLELLLPHAGRISLIGLVRALQAHDAAMIDDILRQLLGQGDDLDARLIILLARPDLEDREALLERGLALLLASGEEPRDRMALAAALRLLDPTVSLAGRIAALQDTLGAIRDNTVFWLLSELCRAKLVDDTSGDALLHTIIALIENPRGPHIMTILEQQLPALLPAAETTRRRVVGPLAELAVRFLGQRGRDLIRWNIDGLGPVVIDEIWCLLEESPHHSVLEIMATLIAPVLARSQADASTISSAVNRLLILASSSREARIAGLLLSAAAELTLLPQVMRDRPLVEAVDEAARLRGLHAVQATATIAAGAAIDPARRSAIVAHLLAMLGAVVPDAKTEEIIDAHTQETVYVLDERLSAHTETLPMAISGLRIIAESPHIPEAMLRQICSRMCEQWRTVTSWGTIWGPGNVHQLSHSLAHIARLPHLPSSLRQQVAETLLARISQLNIARELAAICAIGDGQLPILAGRAARAVLQAATKAQFIDDEIPQLTEVLVDFLLVPDLGPEDALTRRRLASLLSGYRTRLNQRERQQLHDRLDAAAETTAAVADRLAWLRE